MKKHAFPLLLPVVLCIAATSCTHSSGAVWEDTKTLGRYIHRKGRMLWQKNVDSKMVEDESELMGPTSEEYVPMHAQDATKRQLPPPRMPKMESLETKKPQAITREMFQIPEGELKDVFQNIYFDTDRYAIRSKKEHKCLQEIAQNMKNNPDWFLFVEGHCDERADEQYNLALGSKRANSVRRQLINMGVPASRIFTLSLGKEMPADAGHNEAAWSKNRRAVFKLYKDNQAM